MINKNARYGHFGSKRAPYLKLKDRVKLCIATHKFSLVLAERFRYQYIAFTCSLYYFQRK